MLASFSENNLIDMLCHKANIKLNSEDMFSERQDVLIQHSCDLSVFLRSINGIRVPFVSGTFSVPYIYSVQ